MQLLVGECLGVEKTNRSNADNTKQWIETKVHVLDGVRTVEATLTREFNGALPTRGDFVVFEVYGRAYPTRGGAGFALSTPARLPVAEQALKSMWEARLKAADPRPVSAVNS